MHKIDFVNEVKHALSELTNDGIFKIIQIIYDDKNFGNVIVEIGLCENLSIRFIKDRGDINCELKKFDEWFWIDDVFEVLGVPSKQSKNNIIDAIINILAQIKRNLPSIVKAFNEDNIKDTKSKIKTVATKRVMGTF